MNKDYEILNIDTNSNEEEIKRAFRKLSMKYHPENSNENLIKFNQINEAYKSIINKLNTPRQNNDNQTKILNNILSNFPTLNYPIYVPDIYINLTISLETSYLGSNMPIEINRTINNNSSNLQETETVYVEIPKGVDNNEIIILERKGDIVNGLKGDLKIQIEIKNETLFKRRGLDLFYFHKISLKESLCGFQFKLLLLSGKFINIKNKEGNIISPNSFKTIFNMGMTRNNQNGSLIIEFEVEFPNSLTSEKIEKIKNIL